MIVSIYGFNPRRDLGCIIEWKGDRRQWCNPDCLQQGSCPPSIYAEYSEGENRLIYR